MSIYMLNLVFNPADSTETTNGYFMDYDSTATGLNASKVWLKATNTTPNPDVFDGNWQILEHDTSLLTLSANDQVWMRVAGVNISGYAARITIIVARALSRASKGVNGKAFQVRSSPFPLNNGQQSCVIYDTMSPTFQAQSSAGSWVTQLGTVTFTTPPPNPKPPAFHDSYSVIVAATVGIGPSGENLTNVVTYAHDPDMDVDC